MERSPSLDAPALTAEAFGLTISSEFELPELQGLGRASARETDVIIRRASLATDGSEAPIDSPRRPDGTYRFDFATASVTISDGSVIEVDPAPDAPPEVLRHLILGPAVHHVLHQRGRLVLHASTIDVDGSAIAFLGDSGAGKTTTAAAFLLEGHRVLSDDVAAIEFIDGRPMVRGGYPAIKLHESFVERFDPPVDPPIRTGPHCERHFHGLRDEQPTEPVPLARIYALADGNEESIDELAPGERVSTLTMNSYATGLLRDSTEARRNFQQCARVERRIPVRRLTRRKRFELLPTVVDLVEADLGAIR